MTKIALIGSRRVSILAVLLLIIVVWTAGSIDNANADDDVDVDDVDDARQGMKDDDPAAPTAASAGGGGADEQDNDSIIPEAQIIETIEGLKRRIESDLIAEIGSVAAGGATTEGEDGKQQQQQQKVSMMEELDTKLDGLKQMMKRLEEVYMRYNNKQKETMRLIHEANEVQLEKFVERLGDTLENEVSLRERLKTTTTIAEIDDSTRDGVDVVAEDELLPPPPEVTMKTLQEQLNIEEILEESEREITSWILQIVKHELDTFQHKTLAPATSAMKKKLKKQMADEGATSLSTTAADDDEDDGSCPTTGQIVEQVQVSLNKYADDGIGLVDYASQVSTTTTVVSMMTSETFQPPSNQKLGTAWFRSFIPEDWERHLLPDGWEEWNVGVPDYVYHSLGLSGASVVPPEAVLHPKVLPGSCWPMAGSKGQVTLKLEQPVVIDALTVDHVPTSIIPDGKQQSAPKRIVVVAYPPCAVDDDNSDNGACGSLGFDIHQEFEVARMTYDIEGDVSVQTFDSHYGQAIKNLSAQEEDDDDDDEEDEEDAGSCSTETSTSCSVPPRIPAAAVTFKVLENWGEPEFTCIYRLRVHGSPEQF